MFTNPDPDPNTREFRSGYKVHGSGYRKFFWIYGSVPRLSVTIYITKQAKNTQIKLN